MRYARTHFSIVAAWLIFVGISTAGEDKPNIVIILADDLGYADLGCQGCKDIATPHIDSIATAGVRCTDGYATHAICSPSRAGLMSGMYQHRFGFEHNSGPEQYAASNFGVPRSIPIVAERLKAAGYSTAMVGKWHIGFKPGLRPWERGFDYFYGFLPGARSYYPESPRQNNAIYRNGVLVTDEKEYLTDAFARESVAFIDGSKDGPFFLYLAFNAVHSPLEATSDYEKRFGHIADPNRKTYAGMTAAMDDAVGRVLARLREHKLEEKTLVFFYSDNGGPTSQTTSRNDPLRGFKGQVFEGGIRIPFLVQFKGKLPAGKVYRKPVMAFDVTATALAAAGATPTRSASEDGTAGIHDSSPARRAGMGQHKPLDGVDLLPYLLGQKSESPHDSLFWRAGRQHAARVGDWKLVRDPRQDGPDMLFNLAQDIGEQKNLATQLPEKLKEMQAVYDAWDKQMMPPQWVRQDHRNAEVGGKLKTRPTPGARAKGRGQQLQQAFRKADRDGDGKLSAQEHKQPALFKTIDQDGDGFATLEELRAYYSNRRGKAGANRPEQ